MSKQVVVEKRKEGVFHRHPAKKEGHGRSNITAGVRKRQRFRVVSREVRGLGGEGRGDRGGGVGWGVRET